MRRRDAWSTPKTWLTYHKKYFIRDSCPCSFAFAFSITYEGDLVVRGIEVRRHDTPHFIKQFQTQLLHTLWLQRHRGGNKQGIWELLLVTKAIDRIMIGGDDVTQDDLIISKLLGQNIEKYRSLFPHVSAAIQLSNGEDKSI